MSTVIVPIVVQRSATREHAFTALTPAGRDMTITVEAGKDIDDRAVAADVAAALSSTSAPTLQNAEDGPMSYLACLGVTAFLLLLVGFAGVFVAFMLDISGLIAFHGYRAWEFPSGLPIVGDERLGRGLFRLYVVSWLALPVVAAVIKMTDGSGAAKKGA